MRVAAVDLGATSGRVAVVDLDSLELDVVHRFPNGPVRGADGSLRWDWSRLCTEVEAGLRRALDAGRLASIGVDTWGVDYGLLDAGGELVALPFSYRDARTNGWREVIDRFGPRDVYRRTGVQLMAINTLYQLAAHDRSELERARTLLMLPELLVHHLTGEVTAERTAASTTQLVDIRSGEWAMDLFEAIGVDPGLCQPISGAGRCAGTWENVPVHLVGGHDTASAVAAIPDPGPGVAFISSGTWFLVGAERAEPDTSNEAMRANFSNEAGVCGGVRFLKNVIGLWILEECRREWRMTTADDLEALLVAAARAPSGGPVVDAAEERFLTPASMEAEVRKASGLTGDRGAVVRCILDSVVDASARVVGELREFVDVQRVVVVGGGARIELLRSLLEDVIGLSVYVGPAEATGIGNAMVQGIALGRFADLSEARTALAEMS